MMVNDRNKKEFLSELTFAVERFLSKHPGKIKVKQNDHFITDALETALEDEFREVLETWGVIKPDQHPRDRVLETDAYTVIALWMPDFQRLQKKYSRLFAMAGEMYTQWDEEETYMIIAFTNPDDKVEDLLEFLVAELQNTTSIRHSWVEKHKDGSMFVDIKTYDSRGVDEEFDCMLDSYIPADAEKRAGS